MQKKVNYIRAIHFISLFHTLEGIRNSKKKSRIQKIGVTIIFDVFS